MLSVSLNYIRLSSRKRSLRLEEVAEIQEQSPIFLRQVEDCDRRCQSDLGIL